MFSTHSTAALSLLIYHLTSFDVEDLVDLVLVAVVAEHLLPRLQVIQGEYGHDGAKHRVRREQSVPGR